MIPQPRKTKKPSAKEALARLDKIELQNAMLKLDIRNRTIALMDSLWTYETIIHELAQQAGTIGEFRKWFAEFKDVINATPLDDPNHKAILRENLAKMGVHLDDMPDNGQILDQLWESKK